MRSALGGVREASVRGSILGEAVNPSWPPWDFGSSHLLDGGNTSKSPQVTVTDPWELSLDFLQQSSCNIQAIVCTMEGLGLETHGGIVAIQPLYC